MPDQEAIREQERLADVERSGGRMAAPMSELKARTLEQYGGADVAPDPIRVEAVEDAPLKRTTVNRGLDVSEAEATLAEGNLRLKVSFGASTFEAEGPSDPVLDAFGSFRAHTEHRTPGGPDGAEKTHAPHAAEQEDADRVIDVTEDAAGHDGQSLLPVFLKSRKLKTNAEVAAAIATWAKRHNDEEEITPELAEQHWRQSGRKVPSNIPRDMSTAATEGWLTRLGNGRYQVTAYGERDIDGKIIHGE